MGLWSEFLTHDGRTIHKWKHYFPAYERHLAHLVGRPCLLLEIGAGAGGALQMWKRWLGPHALIVGLDVAPEAAGFAEDQIAVRIGHQADPAFLGSVVQEFGRPDVVIDDGSHRADDVTAAFRHLYREVDPRGVYIVEDLHAAYWPELGGGLRKAGSFIETAKGLIDELNADFSRGAVTPSAFTRETLSMHFYDSLLVFERGRTLAKAAPMIPPP